GIRIVKAFRRETYENRRFHERTREYLRASLRAVWARTASKSVLEFVNDVTIPVTMLVGGWVVIRNMWGLDAGKFAMFLALVVLMYMPAKTLIASYNPMQDALPSVDRVFEFFDTRPEIADAPDAVELAGVKDAVRFEDVTFGYSETNEVLRGVSFTARAGEMT